MVYPFIFREEALKEFTEAFVWYEQQRDGLGQSFRINVFNKLEKICKEPFHYKRSQDPFHEALVDKFPFLIIYTIDEELPVIMVFAIFHTSRNPKKKFKRK